MANCFRNRDGTPVNTRANLDEWADMALADIREQVISMFESGGKYEGKDIKDYMILPEIHGFRIVKKEV